MNKEPQTIKLILLQALEHTSALFMSRKESGVKMVMPTEELVNIVENAEKKIEEHYKQKLKIAVEALRFYAKEENWSSFDFNLEEGCGWPVAEEALQKIEGESTHAQ